MKAAAAFEFDDCKVDRSLLLVLMTQQLKK